MTPDTDDIALPEPIKRGPFGPLFTADQLRAAVLAERQRGAKAVEFAEYMAKGAEHLLQSINEEDRAWAQIDEIGECEEHRTQFQRANERRCEASNGLRSDIYEFRKRAARAAAQDGDSHG